MTIPKSPTLSALLLTLPLFVFAQAPAPSVKLEAAPMAAVPSSAADLAWAEVEAASQLPEKRPESLEEAQKIFTAVNDALTAKAAAFEKNFPSDPRRWDIALRRIEFEGIRRGLQLPMQMADDDIDAGLDHITTASDATPAIKSSAAFHRVSAAVQAGDTVKFRTIAREFLAAYPDFESAPMIKQQLDALDARDATEKALKEKPLELKFTAVDGREIDLSAMKGKVVLIDFWATWCPPCVAEIPTVVATYEKLHAKGFEIVGISLDDDKEKLLAMTKAKNMTWAQYFDGKAWEGEMPQKYGISSIPTMWLVNKKGMIVDTDAGTDLAAKVEKLLAE